MHHVTFLLRADNPVEPRVDDAPPAAPDDARGDGHLTHWFSARDGVVEAHYVFDDVYATAHPEALDARHLAMLHALLTFKLFDDGEVLIPPTQLAGVLRWPRTDEARRALGMSEI